MGEVKRAGLGFFGVLAVFLAMTMAAPQWGAGVANAQGINMRDVHGPVTVGTQASVGLTGMVNVESYNDDIGATLQAAINAVSAVGGGTIEVMPGLYTSKTVAKASNTKIEIRFDAGARVTVAASNTSSPAILKFTNCTRPRLSGGRFLSNTFVSDQILVQFSGGTDCETRDTVYEVTVNPATDSQSSAIQIPVPVAAPIGDTAHPMVMLDFDTCLRKIVDHCTFLPDYAVTCLRTTNGAGVIVTHSQFCNNIDAGIQGVELTPTWIDNPAPRLCWRGIQVDGDEWGTIDGCRFFGLGDAAYNPGSGVAPYVTGLPATAGAQVNVTGGNTFHLNSGTWTNTPIVGAPIITTGFANAVNNSRHNVVSATTTDIVVSTALTNETGSGDEVITGYPYELDFVVRIKTAGSQNGGTVFSASESGHFRFVNNTIELCAAPKEIQIWGAPSVLISGNVLGLDESPDALTEGIIYITDGDDGGSGTDVTRDTLITGNSIHNPALSNTLGCGVYARQCSDLQIKGNFFGALQCNYGVQIASATSESVSVVGNSFRGNGAYTLAPVHLNSGGAVANGFVCAANDLEGFSVVSIDDPANGANGGSGNVGTSGTDNFMGTVATTATGSGPCTITRTVGSFITDGWKPGMLLTATGLDTAADNGKVLRVSAVVALTLTLSDGLTGLPISAVADNGTDVALSEYAAPFVVDDSTSNVDYFPEGLATANGDPWKSFVTTGTRVDWTISSNVITRAAGSFITDGFQVGDVVMITGSPATAADAGKTLIATKVTALALTVAGNTITDDATASESFRITKIGGTPVGNVSLD